ncbi:coiled-coil domain-containing protein 170 [Anabrus simplex]|uniref:coiled-coil domain-containing protein 170 n=1 Tax=Anabrus simplex TaxID=316456 RepID=UPI0035A32835
MEREEEALPGNTDEDWRVFEILCGSITPDTAENLDSDRTMGDEVEMAHDVTTALRSDLAALQYKRDRLLTELQDMRSQLRTREQRASELQVEAEQLREQAARQSSIISSLRKRIHELEERERNLGVAHGRVEMNMQTLQRENRYQEEKIREMEKKIRSLELECNSEESQKDANRKALIDLIRRLSGALGLEYTEAMISSPESLIHKAAELVQETARLRSRSTNIADSLNSVDAELRSCRDALERTVADRDSLQRQAASHLLELDRLRQEKESLEMQQRVAERDLADLRDKLNLANRGLTAASGNVAVQEATICQLRDELKLKEEKCTRTQNELTHLLESLAILLSSPSRFVESHEESIKGRIRELLQDNKERCMQVDNLREKNAALTQQLNRQTELAEQNANRVRALEEDKVMLEGRINKLEADLNSAEIIRDGLRRDKTTFMAFLERLARALNVEEISKEVGVELHTETILVRAEQLARLESDKLIDKYWWTYGTFPRCLRRERSCIELPLLRETSAVYQLQRRVRTLREQLQRKDLHLDLLRRKLSLQEENGRIRNLLESERDEANMRLKKMVKQVDRLQVQLNEAKAHNRELKTQLADAADYKISALERGRKIEDLQKRLVESEMQRTRLGRKVTLLKDQVRTTSQSAEQERNLHDHTLEMVRNELATVKQNLIETQRRENALLNLRSQVSKLLGLDLPVPDYEIITRLQKLVHAHRDFTLVSRRYEDPLILGNPSPGGTRTPMLPGHSPGTRTPRYEDSGFVDPPDLSCLDDSDDLNGIYNKRPIRSST